MGESLRISIIAVIVILLAIPLRQGNANFTFLIGLGLGIVILWVVLARFQEIASAFGQLKQYLGQGGGYLNLLLKVLGITYVCDFAANICRDAGFGFVAGQLEVLGKLSVMVSGISVLFILIEQMNHLV